MVGKTEEELTQDGVPYEVGRAVYREIARGQIIGDLTGLLKIMFRTDTRELLGVHIIGEGSSELVHIGQAVLSFGGKVDYFVNTVFNYPTLAECYKKAAFDGINRMGVPQRKPKPLHSPRTRPTCRRVNRQPGRVRLISRICASRSSCVSPCPLSPLPERTRQ